MFSVSLKMQLSCYVSGQLQLLPLLPLSFPELLDIYFKDKGIESKQLLIVYTAHICAVSFNLSGESRDLRMDERKTRCPHLGSYPF